MSCFFNKISKWRTQFTENVSVAITGIQTHEIHLICWSASHMYFLLSPLVITVAATHFLFLLYNVDFIFVYLIRLCFCNYFVIKTLGCANDAGYTRRLAQHIITCHNNKSLAWLDTLGCPCRLEGKWCIYTDNESNDLQIQYLYWMAYIQQKPWCHTCQQNVDRQG